MEKSMEQGLKEQISSSDLIIVGIGSEWNWVKKGINNDPRYAGLLEYCIMRVINFFSQS
jgi:hypothetical protein